MDGDNMKLLEIINEFTVNDIKKTIDFYNKQLGFEILETDGNPISWVKMRKDGYSIMFENYEEVCKEIVNYPKKSTNSNLIKLKYNDKDELLNLYNKLLNEKIKFFMKWKSTDYGSIEFGILDPDENMIILSFKVVL